MTNAVRMCHGYKERLLEAGNEVGKQVQNCDSESGYYFVSLSSLIAQMRGGSLLDPTVRKMEIETRLRNQYNRIPVIQQFGT